MTPEINTATSPSLSETFRFGKASVLRGQNARGVCRFVPLMDQFHRKTIQKSLISRFSRFSRPFLTGGRGC
jgi:hypothetical protein